MTGIESAPRVTMSEEQNGFIDGYSTKPIDEAEVHIPERLSWPGILTYIQIYF